MLPIRRLLLVASIALVVAWGCLPSGVVRDSQEEITREDSDALADVIAQADRQKRRKRTESVAVSRDTERATVRAAFEQATGKALESIPRLSVLRARQGDGHYAPPELLDGSEAFADVADRVRKDPSLAPDAIRFYHACATTQDAPTSIRAVCLRRMKDLAERSRSSFPVRDGDYPELVRRVADRLPRLP